VVGQEDKSGMLLRRTGGTVGIAQRVDGTYGDGWSGTHVSYTRLRCTSGTGTATVARDVHLFSRPQRISAAGRSTTFAPADVGRLTVPLRPRNGVCRVTFTVSPTAVPALVQHGNADTRELGARFVEFAYRAP